MVAAYIAELRHAVSSDRLSKYQVSGVDDLDSAINYFWNMALSEALYASLGALKVTLCNAIHYSASKRFQSEYWFDIPEVLRYRQPDEVIRARNLLNRDKKPHTAGRIIAELNFGFWTTLLSDPYHQSLWMPGKAQMLKDTFPHMTNALRIRDSIYIRYNTLRLLRNRVFHFEPIWYRANLEIQHAQILEAIGWVSPVVHDSMRVIDHFQDTFANGRHVIEEMLNDHLGIGNRK